MDHKDKTAEELFKEVTTDPRIIERLNEVRGILEELGLDKDSSIDYLIGFLVTGYSNVEHLVTTLETIKLSYLMPTVQLLVLASELVTEDKTESALKPV